MKRVLILTVGGSPDPNVSAIKTYNPEYVFFICSKETSECVDGMGYSKEKKR